MTDDKQKITIGIDVSKDKLDLWLSPGGVHFVIKNDVRSIGNYLAKLAKSFSIDKIVLEPTGGYEKVLVRKLVVLDIPTFFVHPNHIKAFQKSKGSPAKTDKSAAMWLSRYAEQPDAQACEVNKTYETDKRFNELASRIRQIKCQLGAELNRLEKTLFDPYIIRNIKQSIKHFRNQLKNLDNYYDKLILSDEEKQKKASILMSFKGVGKVMAQTLILDMPELGQMNKREASSLVGVAPINHDSGKKNGHRYIHGGRGNIRKVLYMAAMVAIRHNSQMKAFYDRLKSIGKPHKVATVAVMRRMIGILNAMVRDGKKWTSETELTVHRT